MDLHYEVRGQGPVLVISQSGEGDADRTADLVKHLVEHFTVLTYDRRGLSRSAHDGSVSLAQHADDLAALIDQVTDAPVAMLGCSFGAVIGLHVAARHPGRLRTLIAHEPVAPWMLPEQQRAHHVDELCDVQRIYRENGLPEALKEIARVLGIDPASPDAEPDLTPQPMNARRQANFDVFIRHDFTAIVQDTLRMSDVLDTGVKIIPAVGRTTPKTVFDYQCGLALADALGVEVAEFPGGHNGNTSHPRGYAERLIMLA